MLTLLTPFVLSFAACTAPAQDAGAALEAPIVLRIGTTTIDWPTFATWLVRIRGEAGAADFADRVRLEKLAETSGIEVSDAEIDGRIRAEIDTRIANAFGGDRSGWLGELERLNSTEETYLARRRATVRPQMILDAAAARQRVISDEALEAEFTRRFGADGVSCDVEVLRLRVVVPPGGKSAQERTALRDAAQAKLVARLEDLRGRALAGEDFSALIQAHSEDLSSKRNNGRPLDGLRANGWPSEVLAAVHALAPGELSAPLFARGFGNLFRMVSSKTVKLEDVRPALRDELLHVPANSEESRSMMSELRAAEPHSVLPAMYSGSSDMNEAVLTVGERSYTRETYARWLATVYASNNARSFVEEQLATARAQAEGITVSDEDLVQRLDAEIAATIERFFKNDRALWLEDLERRGRDEARERRDRTQRTRLDLLVERLIQKTRTFDEQRIVNRWHELYGQDGRAYDVRILRNTLVFPDEARTLPKDEQRALIDQIVSETLGRMSELRERALDGEGFATLVTRYSDHEQTKANGGRFRERFPLEDWDQSVRTLIEGLEPGQVSTPVQVGAFCYMFELLAVNESPLESVREAVLADLHASQTLAAERAGFLNRLQQEVDWSLHLDGIPRDE